MHANRVLYESSQNKTRILISQTRFYRDMSRVTRSAENIKTVTFPRTVRKVSTYAFRKTVALSVVLNEGLETLGECRNDRRVGIFYDTSLRLVKLPSTLRVLGDGTFANCKALRNVTFEKGSQLKNIGECAFADCYNLRRITLPEGLATVGFYAFESSGLEEIMLPGTLKKTMWDIFYGCARLKTVYVQDGCSTDLYLTRIPSSARVGPPPDTLVGGIRVWDLRE